MAFFVKTWRTLFLSKLNFITEQNFKIMSDLTDLQASIAALKADSVASKASLDSLQTSLTTIINGLPKTGGLSEEDVTTLKQNFADAQTASDDAAAEAAAIAAQAAAAANPSGAAQ